MNNYGCIPNALKSELRWVVWRYEDRDDKPTKVPYQASKFDLLIEARSNDVRTWSSYREAIQTPKIDGVGFMLGNGFTGFDFDDILKKGYCLKALAWIAALHSYSEISPSGNGVKVLVKGRLPLDFLNSNKTGRNLRGIPQKDMAVEAYHSQRFFTITGNKMLGCPPVVNTNQRGIDFVCAEILKMKPAFSKSPAPIRSQPLSMSDTAIIELIRKSKQRERFDHLMSGQIGSYESNSEADFALTTLLMFWCGNDEAQVERIFSQSLLSQREKWNREDYRRRTLAKSHQPQVYTPKAKRLS